MKMHWMAVAVVALMASACGGTVEQPGDVQVQQSALSSTEEIGGGGGPCGSVYCGKGTFCCNAGCGVCAPLGGGCPQVVCDVAPPRQEEPQAVVVEQAPVESIGVSCGGNICGKGTFCCNASCGTCAPLGGGCLDVVCEDPTVAKPAVEQAPEASLGESCGGNICGKGTYCCNASCGVCVPKGMLCLDVAC